MTPGWPLQLLLGHSRVVNQRPHLQVLHSCVTLLASHLNWLTAEFFSVEESPKRTRIPLRRILKLLTSHKYHCSHTVQFCNTNHTCFLWLSSNGHPYRFHCQKWRLYMARKLFSKPIHAKEERNADTQAARSSRKDMLTWCYGWIWCLIFYENDCCDLWQIIWSLVQNVALIIHLQCFTLVK